MALKTKSIGAVQKKTSVTDNLFNGTSGGLINNDDKTASELDVLEQELIDLSDIREMKNNKFPLVSIESLAESIDRVRLGQPIILRPLKKSFNLHDGDDVTEISNVSYEIVAGHRRFAAYKYLLSKYKLLNNEEKIRRYSSIPSQLLPEGATEDEIDSLYKATNFETRNISVTDVLLHIDYYLDQIQANDIQEKLINPSFRGTNKGEFISKKFKEININLSPAQVKRYVMVYEKSTEKLLTLFQNGEISMTSISKIIKKYNIKSDVLSGKQDEIADEINNVLNDSSLIPTEREKKKLNIIDKYLAVNSDDKEVLNAIKEDKKLHNEETEQEKTKIDYTSLIKKLQSTAKNIKRISEVESFYDTITEITSDGLEMTKINENIKLNTAQKENIKIVFEYLKSEYEKLEKSIDDVKTISAKYLKIAGEGNQSIAGTLTKFIGEIEYLFINAVKIEYNYYVKKEQARQEQLAIREQMRQEAEERKALENERKKIAKEEEKYNNEISKIQETIAQTTDQSDLEKLKARILELQEQLGQVIIKKEEITNLQNGKAGTVYIISNLGSFGEDVFKIGMTRRLDPQDRINELGSASVPFKFDVHSFIFSDDAVSLENKMHQILNDRRVNKVNLRKEFFKISIDELETLVEEIDPSAEFNKTMIAEEFRQSISSDEVYSSDYSLDDDPDDE